MINKLNGFVENNFVGCCVVLGGTAALLIALSALSSYGLLQTGWQHTSSFFKHTVRPFLNSTSNLPNWFWVGASAVAGGVGLGATLMIASGKPCQAGRAMKHRTLSAIDAMWKWKELHLSGSFLKTRPDTVVEIKEQSDTESPGNTSESETGSSSEETTSGSESGSGTTQSSSNSSSSTDHSESSESE